MALQFVLNSMARLAAVLVLALLLTAGVSRPGAAQAVGVQTFLADPGAVLQQNPSGGPTLVSQIRDLAVANPSTLQPIIDLLAKASKDQKKRNCFWIGSGGQDRRQEQSAIRDANSAGDCRHEGSGRRAGLCCGCGQRADWRCRRWRRSGQCGSERRPDEWLGWGADGHGSRSSHQWEQHPDGSVQLHLLRFWRQYHDDGNDDHRHDECDDEFDRERKLPLVADLFPGVMTTLMVRAREDTTRVTDLAPV